MTRHIALLSVLSALALGGCATIPKPIAGDFAPVTLDAARSGAAGTASVRWGGEIVETSPRAQQTCFFVLAQPLDSQARPKSSASSSSGRFLACKDGFYDPEVYRKGREITVTGTLNGTRQQKIGDYDYTYPLVNADSVYLWPQRPLYVQRPYEPWSPWYDPFWNPYGPWGYGSIYYPRRVIVVPQSHTPAPVPAPAPSKK